MSFRDLIGPGRWIEPAVIQAAAASGSTRYPYAAWMPIVEATTQPKIVPTQFIYHSMAGPRLTTIEALRIYVNRSDIGGESTFILDLDGRMAQLVDTNTRADNNFRANPRAGSVETQDYGHLADPGIRNTPWSDPQLAQLAGASAFYCLRHGVPLHRPAGWDLPGMDGHRAFPEWSSFAGKTCPGQARWEQIPAVLDRAQWIVDWRPPPPPTTPTDTEEKVMFISKGVVVNGDAPYDNGGYRVCDGIWQRRMTTYGELDQLIARFVDIGRPLIDFATGDEVSARSDVTAVADTRVLGRHA